MYTGLDVFETVGQIAAWNYQPVINETIYPGYCGQLNGSAGEFFPPNAEKTNVDFFSPDICR